MLSEVLYVLNYLKFFNYVLNCVYILPLLWKEENETPEWTQLKLPAVGQAPSPRWAYHYIWRALCNDKSKPLLFISMSMQCKIPSGKLTCDGIDVI